MAAPQHWLRQRKKGLKTFVKPSKYLLKSVSCLAEELGRSGAAPGSHQIRRQVGHREAQLLRHVVGHVELARHHRHPRAVLLPARNELRGVVLEELEDGGVGGHYGLLAGLAARQVGTPAVRGGEM